MNVLSLTLHFLSVSLFLHFCTDHAYAYAHTHTHNDSGYLCIFAFVYISVVPACGVTYSWVQNESERGGGGVGGTRSSFLYSSDYCGSTRPSCCFSSLQTDTRLLQGLSHVLLQQQNTYSSQTHRPLRLNMAIVSHRLLSLSLFDCICLLPDSLLPPPSQHT